MVIYCRKWRILVTHIKCESLVNPPQGCLQYHWGKTNKMLHTLTFSVQDGMGASNHSIMTPLRPMTTFSHKITKYVLGLKHKHK